MSKMQVYLTSFQDFKSMLVKINKLLSNLTKIKKENNQDFLIFLQMSQNIFAVNSLNYL